MGANLEDASVRDVAHEVPSHFRLVHAISTIDIMRVGLATSHGVPSPRSQV